MTIATFTKRITTKHRGAIVHRGFYTQGRTFGMPGVTVELDGKSLYYVRVELAAKALLS